MLRMATTAAKIVENEGLTPLVRRSGAQLRRAVKQRCWSIRGVQTLSVAGTTAYFSATNGTASEANYRRYRSEYAVLSFLLANLDSGSVFYDIGANTGLYSFLAADIAGTVVAVEPYPPNIRELTRNASLNDSEIRIVEKVFSDETGELELSCPPTDTPGDGSASIVATEQSSSVTVDAVRADELIATGTLPAPTTVKIDVEGAEMTVIDGMSSALSAETCRLVICEIHTDDSDRRPSVRESGSSIKSIQSKLRDLGFDHIAKMDERTGEIHLVATNNDPDTLSAMDTLQSD